MAKYLKFIVTNDFDLDGGYVMFHTDLIPQKKRYSQNTCRGGGFFIINEDNKEIYLYGESSDFGRCKKEDLMKAIKEHGSDFKSNLWMIMYIYYRSQGKTVKSNELDYTDYKITTDYT